jgi:hypothetical protein
MISTADSFCQKNLSNKTIDSLLFQIEKLQNTKSDTSIFQLQCWDTAKGNYVDSALCIYTIDLNKNTLVKAECISHSDHTNITYYFKNKRFIAALVDNCNEFPSWKGTKHYFNKPNEFNQSKILMRDIGSETEKEVRAYLSLEAYSILKYFNSQKNY